MNTNESFDRAKIEYIQSIERIEKEYQLKNKQTRVIAVIIAVLMLVATTSVIIIFS
jgi:hypothetical protein